MLHYVIGLTALLSAPAAQPKHPGLVIEHCIQQTEISDPYCFLEAKRDNIVTIYVRRVEWSLFLTTRLGLPDPRILDARDVKDVKLNMQALEDADYFNLRKNVLGGFAYEPYKLEMPNTPWITPFGFERFETPPTMPGMPIKPRDAQLMAKDDYKCEAKCTAGVLGGFITGGITGGKVGAEIGAKLGSVIGPVGTAGGALAGFTIVGGFGAIAGALTAYAHLAEEDKATTVKVEPQTPPEPKPEATPAPKPEPKPDASKDKPKDTTPKADDTKARPNENAGTRNMSPKLKKMLEELQRKTASTAVRKADTRPINLVPLNIPTIKKPQSKPLDTKILTENREKPLNLKPVTTRPVTPGSGTLVNPGAGGR